jgi:hypothetical protein
VSGQPIPLSRSGVMAGPERRDKSARLRCTAPSSDRQRYRAGEGTKALGFLLRVRHGHDAATPSGIG